MQLIEYAEYNNELLDNLENSIFRYCSFNKIQLDGGSVDAIFIACQLNELDWYWTFFNSCLFVDIHFTQCIFSGANFSECHFFNCNFINCIFQENNIGTPCYFKNSIWFNNTNTNSIGLPITFK
jgi:uncharacterized protein YjbI with pentapeptide repeats